MRSAFLLSAGLFLSAASPSRAANPTMADDFNAITHWLTYQTAQSLAFNSGSTFDPPNEMRAWRIQPDISLGLGMMPFDKSTFPEMKVQALAEKDPAGDLPDDVKFPNLTVHSRMGLPWRMDLGVRLVNMTIPKNYRLSPNTVGNGQSNTIGIGLRRHFLGGELPLVTVAGAYNRVSGYFNYKSKMDNVELVPDLFTASSKLFGQMDWNVTSIGLNLVVSQTYGKWTPFAGAGYNRVSGIVDGRLEAVWETPLIDSTIGKASNRPEPHNTRLIFGFQRDGSFFRYFLNGEVKTTGFAAGKAYVMSTGLAAPFRVGATSSVVRYGRNKPKNYVSTSGRASTRGRAASTRQWETADSYGSTRRRWFNRKKPEESRKVSHRDSRLNRYWSWGKKREVRESSVQPERPKRSRQAPPELIFIR